MKPSLEFLRKERSQHIPEQTAPQASTSANAAFVPLVTKEQNEVEEKVKGLIAGLIPMKERVKTLQEMHAEISTKQTKLEKSVEEASATLLEKREHRKQLQQALDSVSQALHSHTASHAELKQLGQMITNRLGGISEYNPRRGMSSSSQRTHGNIR